VPSWLVAGVGAAEVSDMSLSICRSGPLVRRRSYRSGGKQAPIVTNTTLTVCRLFGMSVCLCLSVCLFVCLTRCVFLSVWVCVCFVVSTLSAYQSLACFCFFFQCNEYKMQTEQLRSCCSYSFGPFSQCTNTLSIKIFFLPLKHILSPRPPVCNICISTKCMTKMTLFCCCAGNYMQMMMVLKPIAFDVVIYMTQLFDYYLYSVDIYFHCIFM